MGGLLAPSERAPSARSSSSGQPEREKRWLAWPAECSLSTGRCEQGFMGSDLPRAEKGNQAHTIPGLPLLRGHLVW